jgi:acyl-CoA synthetase (AMP-forming)/AMP-acid ligase II
VGQLPDNLPALIEQSAAAFGDRPAIVDGPTTLSFSELAAQVRQLSRALVFSGLRAGDRVSIWSPNTFHWIVSALAAHRAGATLVPLNTRFTGTEARDILSRSSVRVLFVPDSFLGRDFLQLLRESYTDTADERLDGRAASGPVAGLPELQLVVQIPVEGGGEVQGAGGVTTWEEITRLGAEQPHVEPAPLSGESLCDILFTSGTTGRPKGAVSTHRQTIAVAASWADCADVSDRDVYLIINPFFHSFGYKAGWVVALLKGATIVPVLKFDLDSTLETIARERVTILPGPPTVFYSLLAHPRRDDYDMSSLRLAVTGSAPVPVALIERMRRELSFETILTAYGLSEAVVVTMCRPDDTPETISQTSGCAVTDFQVRIAEESGRVLGPGEDGEIQLRGPNIMVGYLDDPEATAAAYTDDHWFRTGDIGHMDQRGYVTITDRLKDMFTSGGFNVYPAEVEDAILSFEGIIECAVIGSPDDRLGEVGLAFVRTNREPSPTEQEIIEHCRTRLANFKVPRRVVFVEDLPHSAAGKVLKRELRESAPVLVSQAG